MVKEIFSWVVVRDGRTKTDRFVVYYLGQEDYHLMDWAGCNFRYRKGPNQPPHATLLDACKWAIANFKYNMTIDGGGPHGDSYQFKSRIVLEEQDYTDLENPTEEQLRKAMEYHVDFNRRYHDTRGTT